MNPSLEVQIIAILVALASAIPGVFLVLRNRAMMSDAISHTILLGIVIAFLFVKDLNSIILIFGAAVVGVLTVLFTETLTKSNIVSEDAAIGIISPLLFSIGIILISLYASNVHLDLDSVLLGELAFAPFDRFIVFGKDIGPKSMYIMSLVLLLNLTFILIFFKELKLTTFDPSLAFVLGFSPILINYLFMGLISITAVSAFNAVGSILVISFMVGPPITAYLFTQDLKKMIFYASSFAVLNAVLGYQISKIFDISIAGSIATTTGLIFTLALFFNPNSGVISVLRRRKKQKEKYALNAMLFHIYNHENTEIEAEESSLDTIADHLNWDYKYLNKMIKLGKRNRFIKNADGVIKLTNCGRNYTLGEYRKLVELI